MNKSPTITTDHLILRAFTMCDVTKVLNMSRETGIRDWLPDQVYHDEQQTTEVLASLLQQYQECSSPQDGPLVLGVYLSHTNELIGHVGLSPCHGDVEIGYAIEETQQGNGYATEAVTAMSTWGAEAFDLACILGIVAAENIRSWNVLENAGFELVEESHNTFHGKYTLVRTYKKRRVVQPT